MNDDLMRLWLALWAAQIVFAIVVLVLTRNTPGGGAPGERFLKIWIVLIGLLPLGGYGLIPQAIVAAILFGIRAIARARADAARARLSSSGGLGGLGAGQLGGGRDDANPFRQGGGDAANPFR